MLCPPLVYWVTGVLLCGVACSQYSSDECNWRGSGLTHELHARDVEQVYLRCARGYLEWLYPTGAIIVNLRPNVEPPPGVAAHTSVCIKTLPGSGGANVHLERAGHLRLLLRDVDPGRVQCFGLQEGALFVEAVPHQDIGRRAMSLEYELVTSQGRGADVHSVVGRGHPCNHEEILMALCTSDFVGRGSIRAVEEGAEQVSVAVTLSRLYRQKNGVFEWRGSGRGWTGRVMTPPGCGLSPGRGELLLTGAVHFGEAWLGCAPRYQDFLKLYHSAQENGTNPCHMDTD